MRLRLFYLHVTNEMQFQMDLKPSETIGCKWIFKRKSNSNGSVDRYKVRLAAKGFIRKLNIDSFDTFAL